jgi:hypothetical protein
MYLQASRGSLDFWTILALVILAAAVATGLVTARHLWIFFALYGWFKPLLNLTDEPHETLED